MMNKIQYTDEAIGRLMRLAVEDAISVIRTESLKGDFEVTEKMVEYKRKDVLTAADNVAQSSYVRSLKSWFPEFGLVGEEDLNFVPDEPLRGEPHFTIDPLDGTKAFVRRSATGIGTMLALAEGDHVAASYVGDVMTGGIYGYGPANSDVFHWNQRPRPRLLQVDKSRPLITQYAVLQDHPADYDPIIQKMVGRETPLFKNIEVHGGSIGLMFAKLWKGEVGAIVLSDAYDTPWDSTPINGINDSMGFIAASVRNEKVMVYPCSGPGGVVREISRYNEERIFFHMSRLDELKVWLAQHGNKE